MSLFVPVPQNHILTSGANSALTWTNAVSVSSMNVSSLGASNLSVSTLTTSTSVSASSLVTSSITANSVGYSTLSGSTITATRLNYSSIVGSSISSNAMTLSLTNASTQNTQIYQVATTNPTTSYTAIQASHVSTGTTNNALVLNPSGGNVGVGTTAPAQMLDITNAASFTPAIRIQNTYSAGYLSMGINAGVNSYIGLQATNTTTSSLTTPPFVVTNTGNGYVGIGTTTPTAKLDIVGATSIFNTASLRVLNSGSGHNGSGSDLVTTQIDLGAGYGPYLRAVQHNNGYTDMIRLDLCVNLGSNNPAPSPRLTILPQNGNVGIGTIAPSATLQVNGSLAKSSGTFDIGHPLHPDTNKRLVHSFIEGPRCDLIYRGKTTLVDGSAVVNIDKECTHSPECAMEDGTFEALCDNPQVFLQNNKTFDRVRGVVSGATLTITCESQAAVEIEWMVIAERADPFIKQWDRTNPDGYLITQYESAAPAAPSAPSE